MRQTNKEIESNIEGVLLNRLQVFTEQKTMNCNKPKDFSNDLINEYELSNNFSLISNEKEIKINIEFKEIYQLPTKEMLDKNLQIPTREKIKTSNIYIIDQKGSYEICHDGSTFIQKFQIYYNNFQKSNIKYYKEFIERVRKDKEYLINIDEFNIEKFNERIKISRF